MQSGRAIAMNLSRPTCTDDRSPGVGYGTDLCACSLLVQTTAQVCQQITQPLTAAEDVPRYHRSIFGTGQDRGKHPQATAPKCSRLVRLRSSHVSRTGSAPKTRMIGSLHQPHRACAHQRIQDYHTCISCQPWTTWCSCIALLSTLNQALIISCSS